MEEWKDVVGYEGLYMVSNKGRVKGLKRTYKCGHRNEQTNTIDESVIIPQINHKGYLQLRLSKDGVRKSYTVHRLVAQAFIDNPANLPQVNHKDEDKTNNCVDNLEWCDNIYNSNYGTKNERVAAKNSKPIKQYTLDGVLVNTFKSAKEVNKLLGYSSCAITHNLRGDSQTSYGYIWKYA